MNKTFLLVALAFPLVAQAQNNEPIVNAPENGTVALSIPQSGNSLVVDSRAVTLPAGQTRLRFGNVGPRVENSLQIALPNARILTQSSLGGDSGADAVLQKSIGQRVTLRYTNSTVTGVLRQVRPFISVETAEGLHMERGTSFAVTIERLPADVLPQPVVEALAESAGTSGNAELRYLTTGLGWSASYRATLLGERLSLAAWATVANASNTNFRNARVSLVAAATAPTQSGPAFALPTPLDLQPNSSREVLLASFDNAAFTQDIVWRTATFGQGSSGQPRLTLSLEKGASVPLPAGALTVYSTGANGAPLLLNSGTLGPFSKGDDIRLALGEIPFVTVTRSIASQRRLNPKTNEFVIALALENSGSAPVTVRIVEPIPADAKVTASTKPPSQSQSGNLEFSITVPAKDNATLQYTVERPI
ncbi:MAG TPA: DUF4139 domain-containing protein [Abditibacteriaceae bacterium]|jgi:hypothetical protein